MVRGAVELNRMALGAGDGARVADERVVQIAAREESELLLFDLA